MKHYRELRAEFFRQRLNFIHTELGAGLTFLQVARTERRFGNRERAGRNLALARQACQEAQTRLEMCNRSDNPESFDAASAQLTELLAAISDFAPAV